MRLEVGVLVAFAFAAVLGACGETSEKAQSEWPDSLPDETIGQFHTEETDSGRVQWRLSAPMARRFIKQDVFLLDDPEVLFFDEQGGLQTTLVSEHGEYRQKDGNMLAYGNVVVTSAEGDILETDSLRYLNETDKIVSDSPVRVTRGNDVMTGIGFEADRNIATVDIKRDVNATIISDDSDTGE